MKRLLAYLFIVLGLGLVVNNFAFAQCLGNCSNGYGMFTWPGGAKYVGEWKKGEAHGQGTFTFPSGTKYVGEWKDSKMHGQGTRTWSNGRVDNGIWKNDKLVKRHKIQTQIAKKEPTQTQQVAIKENETTDQIINKLKSLTGDYKLFAYSDSGEYFIGWTTQNTKHSSLQNGTIISSKGYNCILLFAHYKNNKNSGELDSICKVDQKSFSKFKWSRYDENSLVSGQGYKKNGEKIKFYFVKDPKKFTQIINIYAAQNIKIDSEDKERIAKTTQEEFKPEDKNIDTDPPKIEIAEAITVDSQAYTLKGKVKDKSKQIYLTIDGRPVEVKRGKFTLDRFNFDPEIVEEIKIVAIDKWNNKSEKIVKVTVKLKVTEVVRAYEDLKPNKVKVSKDKNKIAIIIGVEKYKNMTECNYCNRDAKAFKTYATRALGVISSNVISLVDSKATRGEILRAFKISLPRIAGDGGKDINIFFAGHGLASESGKDLYIIPQDGDQGLLEDTAVSRVELIKLIKKVNPKSVTMFFDTCYSGQTRGEQMLLASLRGIKVVATDDIPDNFSIFTASSSNQASSHIEEVKHGMFSYYLMKGLEGKADGNKDKQITNGELIAYLKTNVSKEAFTQNRNQDPMLTGNPDQVLMRYR